MENVMSAADIAAVTRPNMYGYAGDGYGFGMGGGSLIWIALLLLLGGFNGFGGRGNAAATTDELSAGFNFSGINNKLNELTAGQANINQNLGNAICSSTYELGSKIDSCCCTTQRAVDSVKFDMANYFNGLEKTIITDGQKTRDLIQTNEIKALQDKVRTLELAQATCGVVRYPTATVYSSSCNPFFSNTGCGY